jgi:hypothetical protein
MEDEDGDLVTNNITSKFIETLAKIRFKHPDIYKSKDDIFGQEDFQEKIDEKSQ